ncbi:MAG: hypothetical protein WCP85_02270 [Mariniphaga sp.]
MKNYSIVVLLLLTCSLGVAQDKVKETSGKQPKWVNGLVKDYIIISGKGITSQEAQQKALAMVKENIVSAVAENVKSSSTISKEETNFNNKVFNFLEKFASQVATQSAKVPFLQGISLSQVDEYYWEKLETSDRKTYFNYYIKYPFPDGELSRLVFEYKLRDEDLTKQLNDLLAQLDQIESVEKIEKNIGELQLLADYFMDGRKDQASLGITRCNSMLNSIEIVEQEGNPGELKYALRLGTKTISTVKKPVTKSECARIMSTINNQDFWVVKYDFSNCYEDPENNILVKYRFGNNDVSKKFYFDIATNKASIFVNEAFHFTTVTKGSATIDAAQVDIVVISKYNAPFTIEKVVIEFKGQTPVIIDGINQSFSGKGNHNLKLTFNQPIKIEATSSNGKTLPVLSGFIHYKSNSTGEVKTYKVYNHSYTTDW